MNRLAFALALLCASPALAKPQTAIGVTDTSGSNWAKNPKQTYESSQWFAFELKFGSYVPDIDSSAGLNGNTPFRDLFTNQFDTPKHKPKGQLLTQVEFDYQFLHKHGSLGVGATLGFYNRFTHSFAFDDASGMVSCMVPNCTRSGDVTNLYILPLSLLAVYRWDWLALRYHVPLVPYFKIGIAYYIWWITNGSGSTSGFGKDAAFGGSFGWVLHPGLSFLLDVIDPAAARTMDAETGINHTYLFIELNYANVNGFGAGNKMDLSDVTYNAGLSFEF
jgi:hypothetical protein